MKFCCLVCSLKSRRNCCGFELLFRNKEKLETQTLTPKERRDGERNETLPGWSRIQQKQSLCPLIKIKKTDRQSDRYLFSIFFLGLLFKFGKSLIAKSHKVQLNMSLNTLYKPKSVCCISMQECHEVTSYYSDNSSKQFF